MKNLLKIIVLFATLNVSAQITGNPIQHLNGAKFPNATEVDTGERAVYQRKLELLQTHLLPKIDAIRF